MIDRSCRPSPNLQSWASRRHVVALVFIYLIENETHVSLKKENDCRRVAVEQDRKRREYYTLTLYSYIHFDTVKYKKLIFRRSKFCTYRMKKLNHMHVVSRQYLFGIVNVELMFSLIFFPNLTRLTTEIYRI